jgi:hypothetical protein
MDCVQTAGLYLSENDNIFLARCARLEPECLANLCLPERAWTSTPTLQKFHQRNPRALLPREQRWAKGEVMARSASHRILDQNKERERLTHAAQLRLGLSPTPSVATIGRCLLAFNCLAPFSRWGKMEWLPSVTSCRALLRDLG